MTIFAKVITAKKISVRRHALERVSSEANAPCHALAAERDPDRDQNQTREENSRNRHGREQSNIRVFGTSPQT